MNNYQILSGIREFCVSEQKFQLHYYYTKQGGNVDSSFIYGALIQKYAISDEGNIFLEQIMEKLTDSQEHILAIMDKLIGCCVTTASFYDVIDFIYEQTEYCA